MKKLTINGIELEFDDAIEISVDGSRITIKAKPATTTIIHEHHTYPQLPMYPPTWPTWTYPGTIPYSPPGWPIITCGSGGTTGQNDITITGNLQ